MGGNADITIERFVPAEADEARLQAAVEAERQADLERSPEDGEVPAEEVRNDLLRSLSWQRMHRFHALDPSGAIVGTARFECEVVETNQHIGSFGIWVRPEARRSGVGRRLLGEVVGAARSENRSLVFGDAVEGSPGESFLTSAGAEKRLVERKSRLSIDAVDRELLEDWCRKAKERASEYSLVAWDGFTPDELLPAYARVREVMNTAPRDGLEFDDEVETPERTREREESWKAEGTEWWTLVARHEPTGELAGFTELFFSPHRPHLCWQGNTGIDPTHRNKGLGRWVKAANCVRVMDEKPSVRSIDTWNAFSNGPMLGINIAMGFELVKGIGHYQVPTDTLAQFATV